MRSMACRRCARAKVKGRASHGWLAIANAAIHSDVGVDWRAAHGDGSPAGANIVIAYIANPAATDAVAREIVASGERALGVDAHVGRVEQLQMLVDAAVRTFGRIDFMVNNAGVETRTSVLDTNEEQYEKVLSINLESAFVGTREGVVDLLRARPSRSATRFAWRQLVSRGPLSPPAPPRVESTGRRTVGKPRIS